MHRHDETRAGRVRHRDGLFGRGMGPDPRVISANAHDSEIVESAIIQFCEGIGYGGVATVNDTPVVSRNDVAVVSAIDIVLQSRAPMFWLERADFDWQVAWTEVHRFLPFQLDYLAKFCSAKQIACSFRRDHSRGIGK